MIYLLRIFIFINKCAFIYYLYKIYFIFILLYIPPSWKKIAYMYTQGGHDWAVTFSTAVIFHSPLYSPNIVQHLLLSGYLIYVCQMNEWAKCPDNCNYVNNVILEYEKERHLSSRNKKSSAHLHSEVPWSDTETKQDPGCPPRVTSVTFLSCL